MRDKRLRTLALLLVLALLAAVLAGCDNQIKRLPEGAADDDILTFINNADNRPVIRVAAQYYTPDTTICDILQARFPEYLFVFDYSAAAGTASSLRFVENMRKETTYYDLIVGHALWPYAEDCDALFVDLSGEKLLDNYLLSSLNGVSINGRIYCVPGTSTLAGIAFNADMFRQNGWPIPRTQEEFFALCDVIRDTGVTPFTSCFKYAVAVSRLCTMMNYRELFATNTGASWLNDVLRGNAVFRGYYEPVYQTAQRFYDSGVLSLADFSASLTKQRQNFWAGMTAMIDYDSTIYTYAETEGAAFEVGIMPYPSQAQGDAGFALQPEYYIYIPKIVEKNPQRLAFIKEVLRYLSSHEAQRAMLRDSLHISNVKDVSMQGNIAAQYAGEAIERGNLYPIVQYETASAIPFLAIQHAAVRGIFEGGTVEAAIAYTDAEISAAFQMPVAEDAFEVIARAEDGLTMLETSYYIADKLRQATGADIGLFANGGYFRSNLSIVPKGDITSDMRPFIMKGVGANDYLTTYSLTGAQLRELLEYPIINDAPVDALLAASGLKMEYAPWNARGSRVVKVTLADGKALRDDALYTVAAWAGVIDARYITQTLRTYEELGAFITLLQAALRADGVIKPDMEGRLKLIWPGAK